MTNSIWKTPDQKRETGKQILEHWKNTDNEDCYAAWLVAHSFDKQTIRWCYIDDLIAQADKAERLLEITERQNDILQDHFATLGYNIGKEVMDMSDEIKQLIKE